MFLDYPIGEQIAADDFENTRAWHHEGIGELKVVPGSGMRIHCLGSRQSGQGCQAFCRHTLPDQVIIEYDIVIGSTSGLVINYLAMRGIRGEDLIDDADRLPARTGVMKDYWGRAWGLQSYHVSVSRFNDKGEHTGTSNWRRNPGCHLVCHGPDLITEIGKKYHVRLIKDRGSLQLYVDGQFAHGFVDWRNYPLPVPDYGKFGFRLIGSDVMADVSNFRVYRTNAATRGMANELF